MVGQDEVVTQVRNSSMKRWITWQDSTYEMFLDDEKSCTDKCWAWQVPHVMRRTGPWMREVESEESKKDNIMNHYNRGYLRISMRNFVRRFKHRPVVGQRRVCFGSVAAVRELAAGTCLRLLSWKQL